MDCYYWITNTAKVWQKFVQSRVKKIRENLPTAKWSHCGGKENPTDIPTRGFDLGKADLKKKWLFGPDFLSRSQDSWPKATLDTTMKDLDDSDDAAQSKEHNLLASVTESGLKNIINIEKYSSTYKLFRVTGYHPAIYYEFKSWSSKVNRRSRNRVNVKRVTKCKRFVGLLTLCVRGLAIDGMTRSKIPQPL